MNTSHFSISADKGGLSFNLMLALMLMIFMGIGCDSGSDGDDTDNTAPRITITQPTDADTYTTDNAEITIEGTASDNESVVQVVWENRNGETGEATGTASWHAQIGLSPGANQITVTAMDGAGNTATDTLTVTLIKATYTLSGTITAASNTAIDSDVNDPNAIYTPNDSVEQAQVVPTPVTIGGYVNKPGTGEAGRSFADGDEKDVFRADLLADERIVLNTAAPILDADLDIYLYDAASLELIDAAVDRIARTESLAAPDAGTYLIQVITELGASNYTLTIGQSQSVENRSELRLSGSFAAHDVIVELTESRPISASPADSRALAGLEQKAGGAGRARLFSIVPESPGDSFIQSGAPRSKEGSLLAGTSMDDRTREKLNTLLKIKDLRSRPDIALAEPNYINRALRAPNDEHYPLQWHYPLINLPDAWDVTTGSPNVTVAVIDTGVIIDHPDLAAKITSDSYDFISDPERAMDGDGIDGDPDDPGDDSQGGSTFHGTHVAGTVGAASDNNIGVSGVAWNTGIMAIRTLGKGEAGTTYDIIQGIRYAAGLDNDSGTTPDAPADIINLSLGGGSFSQAEQDALTKARNEGVIIIAAAGNSAETAPSYPAAYDGVISVSAVDINATLSPYSNFGATIDVAAPGGDFAADLNADGYVDGVLSTGGDNSAGAIQNVYTFFEGTSMAAPHMAGVAALMKSMRPGLTPDELDGFIQSGEIVRDIGERGRDDLYGHGLIDASKAVMATGDGSAPTILNVSPGSLSFGNLNNTATLTASRVGSDELSVERVTDNADWLTVSESETDAAGLGTYTVSIDRDRLSDGSYTAKITFVSSENTVTVTVNMRISSTGLAPDAGFHYVLLLDSQTDETAAQTTVEGENGLYEYEFTGVEPGNYQLYAGTDSDNDFNIGDSGEAVGAYLSTDHPTVLNVDSDRTGLDFITEFSVNIPEGQAAGPAAPLDRNESLPLRKVEK